MTGLKRLQTIFYADLSDAHPEEDHWVSVAGQRYPLEPFKPEGLKELLARAPHLTAGRNDLRITHCVKGAIPMRIDTVVRVHLRHSLRKTPGAKSETGISHSAIFYPPKQNLLDALGPDEVWHAPPIDYTSTAQNFLFHHPDIINKDTTLTQIIIDEFMAGDVSIATAINNLATLMRQMGPPKETGGWATLEPYTPPENEETGFDGKTTYYHQMPTPAVQGAALTPLSPLLIRIKNDARFEGKKWTVQTGQAVVPASAPIRAKLADIAVSAEAGADNWQAAVSNSAAISGCETSIAVVDSSKRQISIKMENSYIRYLTAYIRFYDANANPISVPSWKPDDAGILYDAITELPNIQSDEVRYIGFLSPMNNVLAVPIGPPGTASALVTFPENAVSASVYGSGLGTGHNPWPSTPALGGTLTGVFNLGVPAFMLGFGAAAQSYKPLYDIVEKITKTKAFLVAVGVILTGWTAYIVGSSVYNKQMNWSSFTSLVSLIFDKAATKALLWVEAELAAGELEDQIPFAGWIMLAVNICTGVAQMAETIVEVATSDWNIENKVSTTITTSVTVRPDPRNKSFPEGKAGAKRSCTVKMIYKDQTRPTVSQTFDLPTGFTATSFQVQFAGNTLGGSVKLEADFYIESWLAGKATTGYVENDEKHAATIDMYLVEQPVPLSAKSIYTHARILTYVNGAYGWTDTAVAPTATIVSRDTSPTGNAIGDWTGLTLSQRLGMIGLAWEAAGTGVADCDTGSTGQLYVFQNINIPGTSMDAVKFPSCGFTGQTRLIYDPFPPKFLMDSSGNWVIDPATKQPEPDPKDVKLGEYYVDPRPANLPYDQGGGYHLRKITLDDSTPFNMASVQPSYGRFAYFPDSVCLHPSGIVIGVSAKYQKLQIVTLTRDGAADSDLPLGQIGAGPAQDKNRPGLLFHPVAVACAYDGAVIVLEDTKSSTGKSVDVVSRLSAYDLHMNPVNRFFDEKGQPSPWLYLSNASDYYYLDLATVGDEKLTYIYILYYTGSGAQPSDYHMAIYTYGLTPPASNPLVVTNAIAAARLSVDMWHSAYTLNFAMVTDGKGQPAGPKSSTTGPAGRTVPSVSMWAPPLPSA
ncbi:hypothetical protein [Methylocystis bryophila]|uniref:hypothetical protein n=1 Tax=Methylocystis bryophila TaxID=655015 RepID=UPI0018F851C1|nr:hypothetical protein [Methylocystis bryophila]BDV40332.1 hypothetical protein DSM21852_35850 [Methylocystis bryophila]